MFLEIFFSVLLLYFVIRPIYLGYRYAHPIRLRISFFTPTSLGVEYDDLVLTTQDGIDLRGWYIHSRNGAAVILLHGHSGNRLAVLHQAEALIRAGYGVLMMDLRAHGHSGGRHFSRSNILVEDVLTAVAYLSKRPEVSAAGIGIYGVSVGGLLALQAASRTVGIRAVMVDDPSPAVFADIPAAGNSWQRWVSFPVQIFYMKITDWFTRQPPLPANSKILPQLAPRSVFFVSTGHGLEQQMVRSLYAAAANQKSIWEIPEARHAAGWREQPDLYDQNLVRFFDNSLVSERDAGVTATPFQPIKA
ncbi:MAG: alpha/beta hydrolase, partial [Anaerolineae bacterium]